MIQNSCQKMRVWMLFIFITTALVCIGLISVNAFANEREAKEEDATLDFEPINTPFPTDLRSLHERVNANRILLIEDMNPWNTSLHHDVLQSLGVVDHIRSSQVLATDLSNYDLIIIGNDQPRGFHQNYLIFQDDLETYIYSGGVVIFNAFQIGWNNPDNSIINSILPGGLSWRRYGTYMSNVNIANAQHPIVTGSLTDNVSLTNSDFIGDGLSAVIIFESLPPNSDIILLDHGFPTLLSYPLGQGTVIANGLAWEYSLSQYVSAGGQFARLAIKDFYSYALSLSSNELSLGELIAYAESKNSENYTPRSWANMMSMLTFARNVYNNPTATDAQINDAKNLLRARLDELVPR